MEEGRPRQLARDDLAGALELYNGVGLPNLTEETRPQ